MGVELDALLTDLAELGERKDLKAAAVGEDRAVPGHEAVETAQRLDQLVAGSDVQVIGVGKLDLTADGFEIGSRERALDGALGADVHEDGRLHAAVRRVENAASCAALLFEKLIHGRPPYRISIASPKEKKR